MTVESKVDTLPQEREKEKVAPDKEHVTKDGYKWERYGEKKTFLPLLRLKNLGTGTALTISLADEGKRVASLRAWSGARHSRAPGSAVEIMNEMVEEDVNADEKLEKMFVTYGHASVADMAQLYAHIEEVPMHACLAGFNQLSLNSGQEKSTRYQVEFEEAPLHALENYVSGIPEKDLEMLDKAYQALGRTALTLFSQNKGKVEQAFEERFKPRTGGERNSLLSRGLDTSRAFLLFGQTTGQFIGDTARNWSRLIADLRASAIPFYRTVAEDLQRVFVPTKKEEEVLSYKAEAPGLIRHSEADETTNTNLVYLKDYLEKRKECLEQEGKLGDFFSVNYDFKGEVEGKVELVEDRFSSIEKAIAQYILSIWPGAESHEVLGWVSGQPDSVKKEISEIVMKGHDHHKELPSLMATSDITLLMRGSVAELRDFNRHRAWGRFINLPLVHGLPTTADTIKQILAKGYVIPSYLAEVEEFSALKEEFVRDMRLYYEALFAVFESTEVKFGDSIDYSFFINLLPFAHQVDLWMHGNPKQSLYMPHLRVRPGGQITYRIMAWEASKLIADSDPYLSAFEIPQRPDPSSREEFFDRS